MALGSRTSLRHARFWAATETSINRGPRGRASLHSTRPAKTRGRGARSRTRLGRPGSTRSGRRGPPTGDGRRLPTNPAARPRRSGRPRAPNGDVRPHRAVARRRADAAFASGIHPGRRACRSPRGLDRDRSRHHRSPSLFRPPVTTRSLRPAALADISFMSVPNIRNLHKRPLPGKQGRFILDLPRKGGLARGVFGACLSPFPRQDGPRKGDRHLRYAPEPVPLARPRVRMKRPWPGKNPPAPHFARIPRPDYNG